MPSSFDSLSATSPIIPLRSPSIVLVILCAMLLKNEPIEVAVGVAPEVVVVVGMRL
jgi:NAD kinase